MNDISHSWERDRGAVFEKLKSLDKKVCEIKADQKTLTKSFNDFCIKTTAAVSVLKVKAGIWGVLGGIAVIGVAITAAILKG